MMAFDAKTTEIRALWSSLAFFRVTTARAKKDSHRHDAMIFAQRHFAAHELAWPRDLS